MRISTRLRHALVLGVAATLAAALVPTSAFGADSEEDGTDSAVVSPEDQTDAPDDAVDESDESGQTEPTPEPSDLTEPTPEPSESQDSDADDDAADEANQLEKVELPQGSTVDPAGTDDPRFASKANAGAMKRGDLTEAEMDRMAMSTGEDLANPGDFEMQASLSGFKPGNIISDHVFYDGSSMSLSQIKSFLNSKVSSCRSGYTCLPDYTQNTKSRSADQYCDGYTGRSGESAAAIIYRVAKSCDINPKALIVILQKEQGLVTHTWPSDWRYTIAMGMACPDTSACDTRYYGFQNQVYSAARQYQVYSKSSYFSWYPVGATSNVRWHPNASCGSAPVYIENKATAALYYYTPYQPNQAALKAGYGTGDSCSAYGNRNFYNYFTDWFGSTHADACTVPSGTRTASKAYVVTASSLNARTAPSTDCSKGITSLSKGDIVQAVRVTESGKWLQVQTNVGKRWVSREYVKYATAGEAACTIVPGSTTAVKVYAVEVSSAVGRGAPRTECAIDRTVLPEGSVAQAINVTADRQWLQVRTGEGIRWVARSDVRYATAPEQQCVGPNGGVKTRSAVYVVDNDTVGVVGPRSTCDVGVAKLAQGVAVRAHGVSGSGDWMWVDTGTGRRWIPTSDIDVATTSEARCLEPRGGVEAASKVYAVRESNTIGRIAPRSDCSDDSTALVSGTVLQAVEVSGSGNWLRVRTGAGERWIARADVRYATAPESLCVAPNGGVSSARLTYRVLTDTTALLGPRDDCGAGIALSAGTVVKAVAISGSRTWLKVATEAGERWVKRADVDYE